MRKLDTLQMSQNYEPEFKKKIARTSALFRGINKALTKHLLSETDIG